MQAGVEQTWGGDYYQRQIGRGEGAKGAEHWLGDVQVEEDHGRVYRWRREAGELGWAESSHRGVNGMGRSGGGKQ